jgi:hypothetical protein
MHVGSSRHAITGTTIFTILVLILTAKVELLVCTDSLIN